MSSPDRLADTTPPDPWDSAGKWLAARYQLTSQEPDRVKEAVKAGRPLSEPRLQEAVCGLAAEILANPRRMPGIVEHYVLSTLAFMFSVAIAMSSTWPHGHHETIAILVVVTAVSHVITNVVLPPRRWRKKAAKALRVNGGIGWDAEGQGFESP